MALILGFRDSGGRWHGDPDGTDHGATHQPMSTTLEFIPQAGEPGADSPFAGQTLQVRVANTGKYGCPGQVSYQVGNGRTYYATEQVDELLFGVDMHDAWALGAWPPPPQPAEPVLAPAPESHQPAPAHGHWHLRQGSHHFDLTTVADATGITIEVTGADGDGNIIARLDGQVPVRAHLHVLAGLLTAAANADPSRPQRNTPANHGGSWTDRETARLRQLHHEGAHPDAIAAELGRTLNSVQYKLWALHLAPRPGPDSRPNTTPPRQSYTMTDLRQTHQNSHKRWEPAEDERLTRRAAEGATVAELMAEFGRNENAITARLDRINAG